MNEEPPTSTLWSVILIAGNNIVILLGFLLSFVDIFKTLLALGVIDALLIILVLVGQKRAKSGEYTEKESTTISRKMFNIIAAVVVAFFMIIDKWLCFFVVASLAFAFGFHEVIMCAIKRRTIFTDAFDALGRQVDPGKPYMASFFCVFSFFIILIFLLTLFTSVWDIMIIFLVATLTWGIGDTNAYLVGSKWGKHKLPIPFNTDKSVEGSSGFVVTGIAIAFIIFSIAILFGIVLLNGIWFFIVSILVGVIGAFLEALARSPYIDDNLITPIGLGVILTFLVFFL